MTLYETVRLDDETPVEVPLKTLIAPVPAPYGTITTTLSSAHETYSTRAGFTLVCPPSSALANST